MSQSQPDFRAISDKFNSLGQECTELGNQFLRCENIPAITGGAAILASLDFMRQDINRGFAELRSDVQELKADVRDLKAEVQEVKADVRVLKADVQELKTRTAVLEVCAQAGETNNVARLWNGLSTDLALPIRPLYSSLTNEVLPDFPATRGDFDTLTRAKVTEYLRLLGQPIQGSPDERLRLLKIISGLSTSTQLVL
ncbi:hypothetical protein F4802DRAFT_592420 [Xylaria palmicola]|nr:hypothetical protein F4802DRAFT_592420 [Xylaria palmicola]